MIFIVHLERAGIGSEPSTTMLQRLSFFPHVFCLFAVFPFFENTRRGILKDTSERSDSGVQQSKDTAAMDALAGMPQVILLGAKGARRLYTLCITAALRRLESIAAYTCTLSTIKHTESF